MDPTQAPAPYDDWVSIYDVWAETTEITKRNLPFYVERMAAASGPVVELGVGNGRIAIEVAKRGKEVTGVDLSSGMLALCRHRAREAGVDQRLRLLKDDFRTFHLPEPAELVVIPFHAIGHMLTLDDKRDCLAHIHEQLAPGGTLVFDHFVFDVDRAKLRQGAPFLRGTYVDVDTGRDALLWVTALQDFASQQMRVYAASEELDASGLVIQKKVRQLEFSWIKPEQARQLLEETGFEVEAVWGDYEKGPFDERSEEQVWVAKR